MSKILVFLLLIFYIFCEPEAAGMFKPETHCARETMYAYGGCTDSASFYENGGLCEEYKIKILNDLTPEQYYNDCVAKQTEMLAQTSTEGN